MSSIILPSMKSGQVLFKDPNRFHDSKYLLAITCEVFKSAETGLVHRGLVWKVYQNIVHSALIDLTNAHGTGEFEVVREPELFMNGPFEQFAQQMKEVYYDSLERNATMEFKFNEDTCQISHEYLARNGLSDTNAAWMDLADFYQNGKPITRAEYTERYGRTSGSTGFKEFGYKETPNSYLDLQEVKFSPEEEAAAQRQASLLMDNKVLDEK